MTDPLEIVDDTGRAHVVVPSGRPSGRRSLADVWALGVLGILVVLFLLPALVGRAPVLHTDALYELVPRAMATARALQEGAIPLWDFGTFAGAKPFYAGERPWLYVPMYPFSLLVDPNNAVQSSMVLALIPYALHVLWAALGGYLFGRLAVRLHPAGAFTTALVYALCPEMMCELISPEGAFLFSHLPWVMLALARFMESGRTAWWCAGTITLAVMGSTGVDNLIIRSYFIAAATAVLLWLCLPVTWADTPAAGGLFRTWVRSRALSLPRLLAAVAMLAVSVGMNGVGWMSLIESVGWMQGSIQMTPEMASGMSPESSMHPLYLATLFLPWFYGVLDVHGWGVVLKEQVTPLSAVSGGMFMMTAVLTALVALGRGAVADSDRHWRCWTCIGILVLTGALFTIMGRFTPVFKWFCMVLPWFFCFPHAVYYRFAACWGVALLAGLGVSGLIASAPGSGGTDPRLPRDRGGAPDGGCRPNADRPRELPWYGRWPVVVICIGLASAGGAVGLLWREDSLRGYEALSLYREWRWFLTRPVLHFAAASALLLGVFTVLPRRIRGWGLATGVAAEAILLAGYIAYVAPLAGQYRAPPDYRPHWYDELGREQRCRTLAEYPPYRLLYDLRPLLEQKSVRVAAHISGVDNQAWAVDSRALLGTSAKPLLPRYRKAIEPFVGGEFHELTTKRLSPAFMRNMNVGYFIAPDMLPYARWPIVTNSVVGVVYQLDEPLPWVYTQDRVEAADDARQLEVLQSGDLRKAVLVDPNLAARLSVNHVGDVSAFEALQATNRVLSVNRNRPNHLTVEADISRPAMLVIVECWHPGWTAKVDGQPAPVWQVNYLQQGLWLDVGRHTVELRFMPESVRRGIVLSGVSTAVFLVAVGGGWFRERRGRGTARTRNPA